MTRRPAGSPTPLTPPHEHMRAPKRGRPLRRRATPRSDAAALLVLIAIQALLLAMRRLPWEIPVLTATAVAIGAVTAGTSPMRILRSAGGLMMILLPVLLVQLVSNPAAAATWASYSGSLIAALLVAVLFVRWRGNQAIARGLRVLLQPLPVRLRCIISDLFGSAVTITPRVLHRMRETRRAASIRFAGHGAPRGTVQRELRVVRAALISLIDEPTARAEAMIVRGIVQQHPLPEDDA